MVLSHLTSVPLVVLNWPAQTGWLFLTAVLPPREVAKCSRLEFSLLLLPFLFSSSVSLASSLFFWLKKFWTVSLLILRTRSKSLRHEILLQVVLVLFLS